MLRNKICRNRNGRRPCAFFSAERTEIGSNKDCNNNKKHNGKGDIFELLEGKEGNPLGRSIMDERILGEYSRAICKQRNDNKIHTKSRTGEERIQTDIRKSAGARLWLITGSYTIPRRLRRGDSFFLPISKL